MECLTSWCPHRIVPHSPGGSTLALPRSCSSGSALVAGLWAHEDSWSHLNRERAFAGAVAGCKVGSEGMASSAQQIQVFGQGRKRSREEPVRLVGAHHDNDFGTYFLHRQLKTDEQINTGRTVRSAIFAGVRVYCNGSFSVRMETLHGLIIENGGTVTWWKHDSAGKPTHWCAAGLTPSQVAEVM
jgi:hypothetical protein